MAVSLTYSSNVMMNPDGTLSPAYIKDPFAWFSGWVTKHVPGAMVTNAINQQAHIIRVKTGSMSYLELTISNELIMTNMPIAQSSVTNWCGENGIRLKIEDAMEDVKEEPPKKKRIRMGKWGVKKDLIRG